MKQMEKVDRDADFCAMTASNRLAKVETMKESSNEGRFQSVSRGLFVSSKMTVTAG